MKPGKMLGIARTVRAVAKDPGKAAGKAVAGALIGAHPIAGAALAKPVAKATESLVNKGIDFAKNPANQQRAKAFGNQALQTTSRVGRQLGAAGARKLGEFRSQIG